MSLKAWLGIFALLLAVVLGGAGYLFWVQNSAQAVLVSFEIPFAGVRLGREWTASELMAVCFGIGFVPTFLWLVISGFWKNSKIRRLEQQVAMSSDSSDSGSSWR